MGRFKDKSGRDMVLAMTHEEVVADLARSEIRSYRQLPTLIYNIQTKWRDDPRPRAGLIRVREFTMLDSYSLDADWEGLDRQYRAHYDAYFRIFGRCGLPVIAVKSDTGMMGGKLAHEFMYLSDIGEDTLVLCDGCDYTANRQVATFRKPQPEAEVPRPIEKVATPHTTTIADLAELLGVSESRTAKAVFMIATGPTPLAPLPMREGGSRGEVTSPLLPSPGRGGVGGEVERFLFVVIRGDMEVNETKLANAVGARALRPATEDEIRAVAAVPGYASPVRLRGGAGASGIPSASSGQALSGTERSLRSEVEGGGPSSALIVVDDLIPHAPNLVAGANEDGYHLLNVNYGRDYTADLVCDIAAARDGDACPQCGAGLRTTRGVEVGNIFQLGTRYSDALGCTYLDREGKPSPVVMGSYGIGTGRLLACIAEEHHDEYGLIWPITVAPYHVYLVALPGAETESERLYSELWAAGVEVLFDDRAESAGVKFMDADLIGIPLRLTIGKRSLQQGGVELKRRDRPDKDIVPLAEAAARIKQKIGGLEQEVALGIHREQNAV
jgi:prolyl-tRNA synthetase